MPCASNHLYTPYIFMYTKIFGGEEGVSDLKFFHNNWEERLKSVCVCVLPLLLTSSAELCQNYVHFAYDYLLWCIWHDVNILNSMQEQEIVLNWKTTEQCIGE
jgi:hypothetical protein